MRSACALTTARPARTDRIPLAGATAIKSLIILSILALSLAGCAGTTRGDRMAQGAGVGAVGGALIGGVASRSVGGAVIGGVAGAAVGAVLVDASGRQHVAQDCYRDRYNRTVCRYR